MTNYVTKANEIKEDLGGNITYKGLESYIVSHGIAVLSYTEGATLIDKHRLQKKASEKESFIYLNDSGLLRIIFIKDDAKDKRFLLAHELGHYFLKHGAETDENEEIAANHFAVNLLHDPEPLSDLPEQPKHRKPNWSIISAIAVIIVTLTAFSAYLGLRNDQVEPVQTVTPPPATEQQEQVNGTEQLKGTEQTYVITKTGDKYHLPDCQYVENKTDILEVTLDEAINMGYDPCKVCIGE